MLDLGLSICLLLQAAPAAMPAALYTDPPTDLAHPATTLAVEIANHGQTMNAVVLRPSGPGPFPLAVLVHGLPGNEANFDLAQTLRRAGWAVLIFHYRGAFGSEGRFTIDGVLDDADAVIAAAHRPERATAWNIDPRRIVVIGHSLGGLAAAHAARGAPDRLGTVLIAPWDPSVLATILRPLSAAERHRVAMARWGDVTHGRLRGTSADAIGTEVVTHGARWTLSDSAAALATRPLLIVTATRDLKSSQAGPLEAALTAEHAVFQTVVLDSDHSFNDRRIALQATILQWLAALPGSRNPRSDESSVVASRPANR